METTSALIIFLLTGIYVYLGVLPIVYTEYFKDFVKGILRAINTMLEETEKDLLVAFCISATLIILVTLWPLTTLLFYLYVQTRKSESSVNKKD